MLVHTLPTLHLSTRWMASRLNEKVRCKSTAGRPCPRAGCPGRPGHRRSDRRGRLVTEHRLSRYFPKSIALVWLFASRALHGFYIRNLKSSACNRPGRTRIQVSASAPFYAFETPPSPEIRHTGIDTAFCSKVTSFSLLNPWLCQECISGYDARSRK